MKLVAGLGNPGEKYRATRHNVGFDVIDVLAGRHGLAHAFEAMKAEAIGARWRQSLAAPTSPSRPEASREDVWLIKPLTFMNLSGSAVRAVMQYYDIALADVLVVCDDVNLPLGRLRLRLGGSEGGHNGLRSMAAELGTTDYPRLRIGVGRGDHRRDLADHVLARFEPDERPGMEDAVARAADAVEIWISSGAADAMNRANRIE